MRPAGRARRGELRWTGTSSCLTWGFARRYGARRARRPSALRTSVKNRKKTPSTRPRATYRAVRRPPAADACEPAARTSERARDRTPARARERAPAASQNTLANACRWRPRARAHSQAHAHALVARPLRASAHTRAHRAPARNPYRCAWMSLGRRPASSSAPTMCILWSVPNASMVRRSSTAALRFVFTNWLWSRRMTLPFSSATI